MAFFAATSVHVKAAEFTVVNSNDSGAGSLRQAIISANASGTADSISFAIPGGGLHTITLASPLPPIISRITIDGYSQAGSVVNSAVTGFNGTLRIEVDGNGVIGVGLNLTTGSSQSVIKGVVLNGFNTTSVRIDLGSNENRLLGNFFGLDASGTSTVGTGSAIEAFSSMNVIGGQDPAGMNLLSGAPAGACLLLSGVAAQGNSLANNLIGLSVDAVTAIGGIQTGIRLESGAHNNVIGSYGSNFNRISGCTGNGIEIVGATTIGNDIRSNGIWNNGGLGIALGNDGVTPNDPSDTDSGPNNFMNYPVITDARTDLRGRVYVMLDHIGTFGGTYRIDLYASPIVDPSGHGEGERWIGAVNLTDDGSGNTTHHITAGNWQNTLAGSFISCTATSMVDGTSEFSVAFPCTYGDLVVTNTTEVVNGDVTSVIDLMDTPGPDGISLREAVMAANNTDAAYAANWIEFDLPGAGPQTIALTSPLPDIIGQTAFVGNSDPEYVDSPVVHVDGSAAGPGASGFVVAHDNCSFYDISITDLAEAGIQGNGHGGFIYGCYLGVMPDGVTAAGNGTYGVSLNDVTGWFIGNAWTQPNVISANTLAGIRIHGSAASGNRIINSHIGCDKNATAGIPGQVSGIILRDGANDNRVGDGSPDNRNIISANAEEGIRIVGSNTNNNFVTGNFIGTDISGNLPLGNGDDGVNIDYSHDNHVINNVIGGNGDQGVDISYVGAIDNVIQGNKIGIGADGLTDIRNSKEGVTIEGGANHNIVGGSAASEQNIISFNRMGISLDSGADNVVQGNYIGLDESGTVDCGNIFHGVNIFNSSDNAIGGNGVGEGNIISGNTFNGIRVEGAAATGNVINGNIIGLTSTGGPLGNGGSGIMMFDCTDNLIGSKNSTVRNVISSNEHGVSIEQCSGIEVVGNFIGTGINGLLDRGNQFHGVDIENATAANTIGLIDSYAAPNITHFRNVISGNGEIGIRVTDSPSQIISGNYIGTNSSGSATIPNDSYGVQISGTSADCLIGTDTDGTEDYVEGNLISGNSTAIYLTAGNSATDIRISGNKIGTDATGNSPLGNDLNGIEVTTGFGGLVIGTDGNNVLDHIEGNVICASGEVGILLIGAANATISGNDIGIGNDGVSAMGNVEENIYLTASSLDNVIGYHPSMSDYDANIVGNRIMNGSRSGISISGSGSVRNRISFNRISDNATLGIDLGNDQVTSNDNGDTDTGENGLMNFPVIQRALIEGDDLRITGFAPPGSEIEFFRADPGPNPDPLVYPQSFGEGQMHLFTFIEGGPDDLEGATSFYSHDGTNSISVRAENEFEFLIDVSSLGIAVGDRLTSTAIDADGNTSEFSAVRSVTASEICNNMIDDDGDGKTDSEDPECLDCDGDMVLNALDLDDDNDGILDTTETLSDLDLENTIGMGNSLNGTGSLALSYGNVGYVSGFPTGECVVDDAGLQGHALHLENSTSSFRPLRFDFNDPVTNLSFKMTDMDDGEVFDIDVYDENFVKYDLTREGIVSIGSYVSQNASGARFAASDLVVDVNGNEPVNDQYSSVIFHFPGKVGTVILSVRLDGGRSIWLTEMSYNVVDTDSDGVLDPCDLDSDNDGLYDCLEASGASSSDPDLNGIIGSGPSSAILDSDNDGWSDLVDPDSGGSMLVDPDSDDDGLNDRVEIDSDSDGCQDATEAGFTDGDGDGALGDSPVTVDAHGAVTSGIDGYTGTAAGVRDFTLVAQSCDNDGDGINPVVDIDDDNDGIRDVVEVEILELDYQVGWQHSANTGEPSIYNTEPVSSAADEVIGPGIVSNLISTQLDCQNVDAQDLTEARQLGEYVEYSFTTLASIPNDYFLRSIAMFNGSAANRYNFDFAVEWTDDSFATSTLLVRPTISPQGAGVVEIDLGHHFIRFSESTTYTLRIYLFDVPASNSGIARLDDVTIRTARANIDDDADGVDNHLDLDSDNDGIFDCFEANGSSSSDPDFNGIIGNGPSSAIVDSDSDGWSDIVDPDSGGMILPDLSSDADGKKNRVDTDSDADGCDDVIEAGFPDADGDGQLGGMVPPTIDATGVVTSGGM